jgi:hypothetical protein
MFLSKCSDFGLECCQSYQCKKPVVETTTYLVKTAREATSETACTFIDKSNDKLETFYFGTFVARMLSDGWKKSLFWSCKFSM